MPNPPRHVNDFQRKICARPGARVGVKSDSHENCADNPVKLADIRKEYTQAGLDESDAARDPLTQFESWMQDALDHQLPMANAMTLASVTPEGMPDARIVLLKGIDNGGFVFYTNYASPKGRQLALRPQGCLVFFWVELERQVRITGAIEKVSAEESDAYFSLRPLGSRHSAWASAQSSPVSGRTFLEEQLAIMEKRFGEQPPRPPHWGGYRLIPDAIEFWQGRPNRLHDRLLYRRDGGTWTIGRLAP